MEDEERFFIEYRGKYYESVGQDMDEINGPDLESICEYLDENGDGWEEETGVCIEDVPSCSEALGVEVHCEKLEEEIKGLLKDKRFIDKHVRVYRAVDSDERKELVASFTMSEVFAHVFERAYECEYGFTYNVRVAVRQLGNFLNRGAWQYGLIDPTGKVLTDLRQWPVPRIQNDGNVKWSDASGSYKAVVWFGLEGEAPIECWKLYERVGVVHMQYEVDHRNVEPDDWKYFWYGNDGFPPYEMIWDKAYMYDYWVVEVGIDMPYDEFEKVRNSCPIQLSQDDSTEEMVRKVAVYCLRMQKKKILEQAVMKGAYEEGKKYLEDVGYLHEGEHIEELLDKDNLLLTKLTIGFEDHMAETLFRDEKTYMIEIDESLFGNDRIGPYREPGSTWNILDHYFEKESEVWKWVMKGWNEVIKEVLGEKYDHDYEAEWLEVYGMYE